MANIMFKRGQQAQLPATAQDGVFYLTTDTNRLYVGQGTEMALLNQTVQIVAAVANLPKNPTLNDFYYCTAENILAIYNGTEWKQINPDTDTNDNDVVKVDSIEFSEGTINENKIDYTLTLKQKKTDIKGVVSNEADITATFSVDVNDMLQVLPDQAQVDLDVVAGSDSAIISTGGVGADTNPSAGKVTIAGGDNVDVAVSDSTITIKATDTTYSIDTKAKDSNVAVNLHNELAGSDDTIQFAAGTNLDIAVANDVITYSHETINTANEQPTAVNKTLSHDGVFDVVTGVTTSNGHVTAVTTQRMQLPKDNDTKISAFENTDNKDWKITYVDTAGTKKDIDFSTDAAALKENLEKQIADGLAAANTALTYKGAISSYEALATKTNVEIGDVWLLDAKSGEYEIGDMFIAVVKAGGSHTGGVIADGDVEWTYVPSGDELNTDTLFYGTVNVADNKVTYALNAKAGADGTVPDIEGNQDLVIKGGEGIVINGSAAESVISHKTYTASTPDAIAAGSKTSFTAITGVTIDNGHIVQVDKQTFTPKTYELDGESNKISLKSDGAEVSAITVTDDNSWIETSVAADVITVNHKTIHSAAQNSDQANNIATNLAHGGSFTAITGVQYDKAGHITDVNYQTLNLPKDNNTTYDYFVGNAANSSSKATVDSANPYFILRDSAGVNDSIQVKGDDGSLSVKAKDNIVTVSMVWGSFN